MIPRNCFPAPTPLFQTLSHIIFALVLAKVMLSSIWTVVQSMQSCKSLHQPGLGGGFVLVLEWLNMQGQMTGSESRVCWRFFFKMTRSLSFSCKSYNFYPESHVIQICCSNSLRVLVYMNSLSGLLSASEIWENKTLLVSRGQILTNIYLCLQTNWRSQEIFKIFWLALTCRHKRSISV